MNISILVTMLFGGLSGAAVTLISNRIQFNHKLRTESIKQLEQLNFLLEQIYSKNIYLGKNYSKDEAKDIMEEINEIYKSAHNTFFSALITLNDAQINTDNFSILMSASNDLRQQFKKFESSYNIFSKPQGDADAFKGSKIKFNNQIKHMTDTTSTILLDEFNYSSNYAISD